MPQATHLSETQSTQQQQGKSMKPIVHYDYHKPLTFEWNFAYLTPLDHPNTRLNGIEVNTSAIVSYDEVTGIIETMNSIYVPKWETK